MGGPALRVVDARTDRDLVDAVRSADSAGEPVLVVGGGSNLVVADDGFPGTVVRVRTRGVDVDRSDSAAVRIRVAAGEPWDELVAGTVAEGWSGLEALSGIPGSTGATPIQNVGAYGAEVASLLESVEVLDRATGQRGVMLPADLAFGYRTSVLKRVPERWLVLAVALRLNLDPMSGPVRYAELAGRLGVAVEGRVPLADAREAVLELRRGKGMVLDPGDHDTWSAGSFFTNPILTAEQVSTLPADAPRFDQNDGRIKTSAAWLISHSGFPRGFSVRPGASAALSTKHSLAVTNPGGATTADILELARVVRAGVAERFGVLLDNEPVLVGCAL